MSNDSLHVRLSLLEGKVNAIPDASSVSSSSTVASSVANSGNFTAMAETALGLTQDAAWHTITVGGVPASAKGLLLIIYQYSTSTVTANSFKVTNDVSHATFYTVAYQECDLGSNKIKMVTQVRAPVLGTFEYYIDNDADWIVSASIQGYFT